MSLFKDAHSSYPHRVDLGWEDFAHFLQSTGFPIEPIKAKVTAFSPATFSNNSREKKNVEAIYFAPIDLDGITTEQLHIALNTFQSLGISYVFYTSYNHCIKDPGLWRCRFLLPYDRPVSSLEYQQLWPRLRMLFSHIEFGREKPIDPCLKKPAQIYFAPAQPPNSPAEHHFQYYPGKALPIDELLATPCDIPQEHLVEPGTQPCPLRTLESLAKKYKSRSSLHLQEVGHALYSVTKGEPFAPAGGTDEMVWAIAQQLAKDLPSVDPESIATHFFPSIQIMNMAWEETHGVPGEMSTRKVQEKIERAQITFKATTAKQEQERLEAHQNRCKQAWAHAGFPNRSTPYTPSELEAMRQLQGETEVDQRQRWIAYKGNAIYFRLFNTYVGPFNRRDDGSLASQTYLAPATSAEVTLTTVTREGEIVLKPQANLCREYGTNVQNIIVDLSAEQSYIDRSDFVESVFRRRDLPPQHSPEVDHWLRLLGGEKCELLLDWLCLAQSLSEPLCMLFMHGSGNAGKSLLASALARLWGTSGPANLERALGQFNTAILESPILFADERLPKDWRGNVQWDNIREIVQSRARNLERKYCPQSTIRGCSRLIGAANSPRELVQSTNLSEEDVGAISERILLIDVGNETNCPARDFLVHQIGDARIHTEWIENDEFAKHLLWLKQNRVVKSKGRFGVVDPDKTVQRALSMMAGARYYVGLFLVRALLDPTSMVFNGRPPRMRIEHGQLLVNVQVFTQFWDRYISEPMPNQRNMQQALKSLSHTEVRRGEGRIDRMRYRSVLPENLIVFAEDQDEGDAEQIIERLNRVEVGAIHHVR